MAASPLYSLRTQRALNFGNGDGTLIFKNIQLDIGAPHQFMDFQPPGRQREPWRVLARRTAAPLMDVEPMGEEFVHGMCHDIEDPTFDATAGATNPYAQVRLIHRPPRVPSGRDAALPLQHVDHRPRRRPAGRSAPESMKIVERSGDRAHRHRRSRASTPRPAAGTTTRASSIPTSRSKTCRTAPVLVALQEALRCRRTSSRTRTSTASPKRWASTKPLANAPQVFTGTAVVAAGRLPSRTRHHGRRRRSDREVAPAPPRVPAAARTSHPRSSCVDERNGALSRCTALPCFHEPDDLSWIRRRCVTKAVDRTLELGLCTRSIRAVEHTRSRCATVSNSRGAVLIDHRHPCAGRPDGNARAGARISTKRDSVTSSLPQHDLLGADLLPRKYPLPNLGR